MRLCAAIHERDLDKLIDAIKRLGLSGTALPLDATWTAEQAEAVGQRFRAEGIAIAQVGCYTNLEGALGPVRQQQMERLKRVLTLAAHAGARCVVSCPGHMNPDLPEAIFSAHPDNWTEAAMDRLVESCREVADAAATAGVTFCLESWVVTTLNSPERLAELVRRVGTREFGILFDPVNLMNLDTYFGNARVIEDCFDRLGDAIQIVHAKDTRIVEASFTYHMSEVVPGDGILDYATLLRCMGRLSDPETPLVIEHVATQREIERARDYIRQAAAEVDAVMY